MSQYVFEASDVAKIITIENAVLLACLKHKSEFVTEDQIYEEYKQMTTADEERTKLIFNTFLPQLQFVALSVKKINNKYQNGIYPQILNKFKEYLNITTND